MSFWNIKDHEKRDAMIKDYIATVKHIQQRSEDEKLGSLTRQAELEEQWRPVVKSQDAVTEKITKELEPIKEEIVNLRESLLEGNQQPGPSRKRIRGNVGLGAQAERFMTRNTIQDPSLDRTFGIRITLNHGPVIGNTPITLDGDDIIIRNDVYDGTPGLWSLITDTQQDQLLTYTKEDLLRYIDILRQTSVLHKNSDPRNGTPRASSSWKWKHVLGPIWNKLKEDEDSSVEEGGGIIPGCRVFLKRNGVCCQVKKMGKGLYLAPGHDIEAGDGLYIQTPNSNLYEGKGIKRKLPLLNILI